MRSRRARGDGGMATVLACVCALALIAATALALQFGATVVARHRAENAAEMGALAGAGEMLSGADVACSAAARMVAQNSAAVESCTVEGADVLVTASVDVRVGPLRGRATGRARAGPVAAQSY